MSQARAAGALEKAMTPDGERPAKAREKGKLKDIMINWYSMALIII